jgi:hypothetical protein
LAPGVPGSGVRRIEYRLGAAAWETYDPARRPVLTADGPVTVRYRAVDHAGNVETAPETGLPRETVFGIDRSPPTVVISEPRSGRWVQAVIATRGTASDGRGTGVAAVQVRFRRSSDGAYWKPRAAPNTGVWSLGTPGANLRVSGLGEWQVDPTQLPPASELADGGSYYVIVYPVDRLGQTKYHGALVQIDQSPPVLAATFPAPGATVASLPAVLGTSGDARSGVRQVLYQLRRADGWWWNASSRQWTSGGYVAKTDNASSWRSVEPLPAGAELPAGRYRLYLTAYDSCTPPNRANLTFDFTVRP